MVISTLRRKTTVTDAAEYERRAPALAQRLQPLLARQPGFLSRELRREGDDGRVVETTAWKTSEDCRAYLRNGAAAMAATIFDAFFPTAPYPDGTWLRETAEQPEAAR